MPKDLIESAVPRDLVKPAVTRGLVQPTVSRDLVQPSVHSDFVPAVPSDLVELAITMRGASGVTTYLKVE